MHQSILCTCRLAPFAAAAETAAAATAAATAPQRLRRLITLLLLLLANWVTLAERWPLLATPASARLTCRGPPRLPLRATPEVENTLCVENVSIAKLYTIIYNTMLYAIFV